jgi:hypothetical protein
VYRKPLDDNIYKQSELMVIRLVMDYGELVKVAQKKEDGKRSGCVG